MIAASRDPATGQGEDHLCSTQDAESVGARVHRAVVGPFREMQAAGRAEGFDIRIDSGFRGFAQQLSIWNRKATGQRPVLDSAARPIDITTLSETELVFAILRWSALPGASRHHWGTDLDIYDEAARPKGYDIELIPAEVDAGGMFGPLHEWLDERIAANGAWGFFRPYDMDRGGVAPERWHMSHAPTAAEFERVMSPDILRETIERADMALNKVVVANIDAICERFVVNVNPRRP